MIKSNIKSSFRKKNSSCIVVKKEDLRKVAEKQRYTVT